jgi:hypothetical protein
MHEHKHKEGNIIYSIDRQIQCLLQTLESIEDNLQIKGKKTLIHLVSPLFNHDIILCRAFLPPDLAYLSAGMQSTTSKICAPVLLGVRNAHPPTKIFL